MFKVMKSGKRQKKQWKRMVTKPTFVGTGFTRKPPKYERFIRPTGTPTIFPCNPLCLQALEIVSLVVGTILFVGPLLFHDCSVFVASNLVMILFY